MKLEDIERRFAGGECIVDRGTCGRTMFVVQSGNVLLQWHEGEAPHLLTEGNLFGERTAILGEPYAFRAEAQGEATVLAIDVPLLNRLCVELPEFSVHLIRHLAERAEPPAPTRRSPSIHEDARLEAHGESLRFFARTILARRMGVDEPSMVRGRLAELAGDARIPMIVAYFCLQELLDQRVVRLLDDRLSVQEPGALERIAAA